MNNHSDNLFDGQEPLDDETLWDMLSLYVDGEATPEQAKIVEHMLSSDPAYRRDFDFLMQSAQTLHAVEEVAPPEGLRDAIYAQTSRRPTLVGRLRAAWSRVTAPALGRYATLGGALAAAALVAAVIRPHGGPTPTAVPDTHPIVSSTVHTNTPVVADSGENTPLPPVIPDINPSTLEPFIHSVQGPSKVVENGPRTKPPTIPNTPKPAEKSGPAVAARGGDKAPTITPRNYPVPKSNTSHEDGVKLTSNGSLPGGYPYDKKMDNGVVHERPQTIFAANDADLGSKVVTSDEKPVPTLPAPEKKGTPTDTQVTSTTLPAPAPTPSRVRVATLPPEARQNIAANIIRHDIGARYSGYDRNVAENIQRHEVMVDVIKGTF